MLAPTATITTSSASIAADNAILDLEQQIQMLDAAVAPLNGKTKKKLAKIEDELANHNFLINSGLGSKDDEIALRNTKCQLRERCIKMWGQLEVLPSLEEERQELARQLNALRRRYGILDVTKS